MLLYLIILLMLLPFLDLYLLIEVAGTLGFLPTIALIILTGTIGAFFIRREGRTVLRRLGTSVTAKEVSRNVLEGGLIVLGGVMLLSPGFLTDCLGFLLVIGWSRTRIVLMLEERLRDRSNFQVQVERF